MPKINLYNKFSTLKCYIGKQHVIKNTQTQREKI